MTLATRCPNCQTVFKVVQDQLRVSEGWVRCGRCAEVFNAAQNLVDPATGESRRAPIEVRSAFPAPVESEAAAASDPAASPSAATSGADAAAGAPYDDDIEAELRARLASGAAGGSRPAPLDDGLAADGHLARTAATETTIERAGTAGVLGEPAADPASREQGAGGVAGVAPEPAPEGFVAGERRPTIPGELPSFVRAAQRAERWRRPGVRAALAAGVVLGALLFGAQWLYVYRDQAAARWPELRPLLARACATLGCRVEAVRSIDALTVESSGLVRVEKSDVYRLNVALRNQREFEVALPAIDLALTDTQGRLIARRVLRASELGAAGTTLAAASELAMQATIQVAAVPVSGYTIELFYP